MSSLSRAALRAQPLLNNKGRLSSSILDSTSTSIPETLCKVTLSTSQSSALHTYSFNGCGCGCGATFHSLPKPSMCGVRMFSTQQKEDAEENKEKEDDSSSASAEQEKDSDTHQSQDSQEESTEKADPASNPFESKPDASADTVYNIKQAFLSFKTELGETWRELIKSDEDLNINKIIAAPRKPPVEEGAEGEEKVDYSGGNALMVVNEKDSAWEKMRKRLADSPIINDILKNAKKASKVLGVDAAGKKLDDIGGDAREVWETSQNPWVYRISSVWDTFTAESDEARATKELRRLDADFDLEIFKEKFTAHTVPLILGALLRGDTKVLKPWLGQAVYGKLSAEILMRKKEGIYVDQRILDIGDAEVVACAVS